MDGFLVIDKPYGITSFDVIRELRRIINIKKMGHSGTLDPLATGVLVIAINKATKKLTELIGKDKVYEAEIKLGEVSETYDKEGPIRKITNYELRITKQQIEDVCKEFVGEIEQMPPIYSAKKINGERASDKARRGETVILKPKKIRIYSIEFFSSKEFGVGSWEENLDVFNEQQLPIIKLRIHCSSGTYIRSLAHDIGQKLGCGAYLYNLIRTRVGDFGIEKAIKIEDLKNDDWEKFIVQIPE